MKIISSFVLMMGLAGGSDFAYGTDISSYLQELERTAMKNNSSFKGFSETAGKLFFVREVNKNGKIVSCSSCHTQNPKAEGQTRAHKTIEPLAPSANPKRFTDIEKIEKWFGRNCRDVLDRECTLEEKGNVVLFLKKIK